MKNQGIVTNLSRAKPNSSGVNNSISNAWNLLTIFWAPPKGLGHFSSSTLCSAHSLSPPAASMPLLLLFLVIIPWYWCLQNCRSPLLQLDCTFTNSLSPGLSSGTSALPHSAKPQLFLTISPCLQNQYHLGDSYHYRVWLAAEDTALATSVSSFWAILRKLT